jgi:hypothetical protein
LRRDGYGDAVSAIDQLRSELRRKFPAAHAPVWRMEEPAEEFFALTRLEAFRGGTISELVPTSPCPVFGLLLAGLLGEPEQGVDFPEVVLVDGGEGFDPDSFTRAACSRLLWVRCTSALEMLQAGDLMVRDGNISTVVMDAVGLDVKQLRSIPASAWWRLKQGAEQTGCRLLVMSPVPLVPCASLRLALAADLSLADLDRPRAELLSRLQGRLERLRHAT